MTFNISQDSLLIGFFADSFADRIAVSAITDIPLKLTIFADFR